MYEDESLMVIDKPAGMVVNRAESVKGETVQEWAERKLKINLRPEDIRPSSVEGFRSRENEKLKIGESDAFKERSGIVHRLDKETSGVLLIAKTPKVFEDLQRQFKERNIEKGYIALVHGKVFPEEGSIKAAVGRLPWNRERFGVLVGGREAETRYKRIMNYELGSMNEKFTLIELYPKTGRTHQLRVHLKSIGHPIVSDAFYAGRKTARRDRTWCPRLFLHAKSISFSHPRTGQKITVASELPEELNRALVQLQANS